MRGRDNGIDTLEVAEGITQSEYCVFHKMDPWVESLNKKDIDK
jgi:hypothetical protein